MGAKELDKICLEFASHHFLLYVVYMCQKSLNFTYAFKCYHQKCKLASPQLAHPVAGMHIIDIN